MMTRRYHFHLPFIAVLLIALSLVDTTLVMAKSPGQEALDQGVLFYDHGEYDKARKAFQEAVRVDPGLLKAWENLGWTYYKLGNHEKTLQIWDMVMKVDPNNIAILNQIGILHLEQQSWTEAIVRFIESLQIEPEQPDIQVHLGAAYEGLSAWHEAIAQYKAVFQRRPGDTNAILRLIKVYIKMDRERDAIALAQNAIARDKTLSSILKPRIGQMIASAGDRAYEAGDYKDAEDAYWRAIEWDPFNSQYLINLGWAYRRQGKTRQAIEWWQKAIRFDEKSGRVHRYLADAYFDLDEVDHARLNYETAWRLDQRAPEIPFRLAEIALKNHNTTEAMLRLSDIISTLKGDGIWLRRIANLFVRYSVVDEGIAFMTKRLTASGGRAKVRAALAYLYTAQAKDAANQGRYDDALRLYQAGLLLDPKNRQILRDMGWAYWHNAQWKDCEKTWKSYQRVYPQEIEPYNLLTRMYLFRRQYRAAIDSAKESIRLDHDQPGEKLNLAKALFWDRQYNTAKELAEGLSLSYPDHVAIQSFWGEILMQYHDFERGEAQWRKVIYLGADLPAARYYWLRSIYERGDYERAIEEARKILATKGPEQAVIRFLAEDAVIRSDVGEAIRWYRMLTENFPNEPSYWLDLARITQEAGLSFLNLDILKNARAIHPDRSDILIALAENYRLNQKYDEAYYLYTDILRRDPASTHVLRGILQTLIEEKRFREALTLINDKGHFFLTDYEIDLIKGRIYADMLDYSAAQRAFVRIVSQVKEGTVVPILLYHGLSSHPRSLNLSVYLFESQMRTLKEHGYSAITLQELERMIDGKKPFPTKPILITFDDARIDSFQLGDTILAKYNMKATMFVPTAYSMDKRPFFADWEIIRSYEKSGRWDIQSHGHHAHDPIPINSATQGRFLTNRMWLEDVERLETHNEYVERLDRDYAESVAILRREIPGVKVIGYAFPFSEAVMDGIGNAPEDIKINEGLLSKYFRFGFIQDMHGFNVLKDSVSTMMLQRFSVPRSWDGQRLLRHLAFNNPASVSLMRLGQSYYWHGQYETAITLFRRAASEEPLLRSETEYHLGTIYYRQSRYREAWQHIAVALAFPSEQRDSMEQLAEQIRQENRPQIDGRFNLYSDSNERANLGESIELRCPLCLPFNLSVDAGLIRFQENGFNDIYGQEFSLGAEWQGIDTLTLGGKVRVRALNGGRDTQNMWLNVRHLSDFYELRAQWSYEDIETLRAHEIDLQAHHVGASARIRFTPLWSGEVASSYLLYDDDNKRTDIRADITYRLPPWPDWQIGGAYMTSDTRLKSDRYYTPEDLHMLQGIVAYDHVWKGKGNIGGEGRFGFAEDAIHGSQWVGCLEFKAARLWNRRFTTSLGWKYNQSPSYHGWTIEALIGYVF